ncbi:restriction endonuclease subunit S [Pseudoalteromonas sp. 2CM41L]|uniref:restriction endonuclease subunit S n=1 Tax=Pseudoalteromonas sp. 2CM41L TaxID=2929857 RepID=UPI0020C0B471|nr:restriction endonuclease subunit S [Pseudoalteromonas sp. 2CM41L]MCK8106002.1 restriction endonuclease subunit S [Pseudoalteromonas sp. 2CM41L]
MEEVLYKLPDGWEWHKLKELTTKIGSGATPKGGEKAYKSSGISLIRSLNVHDCFFKEEKLAFIDDEQANGLKNVVVESGDVLLNITGASIARCCIVPNEFLPARVNQHVTIIRPTEYVDSKFLNYLIVNPKFKSQLLWQGAGGATRQALTKAMVEELNIPIPSLPEQKRIVEKLDALLSRIDTAIEHLQESVTLADALSKNGLSEIFESLKDSYAVVPLSSVVKINSGIALPKLFKNGFSDGDIPFFKVAQMNNHHENMVEPEITFSEIIAKEHKIKLFPKGSTLIPKRGGAILTNKKRMLLEDASYDSNIMGLKANEATISDDYLFAFMRTIDLANFVDASTIPQVNNKHIVQMQIPLASTEKQANVVSRVNLLVKKVETMNSEIQRQLNDLQALKSSILDSAFKGAL